MSMSTRGWAAAAVLALAAGGAVAAAAPASALTPTELTLARSTQTLTYGDGERITGTLVGLDGTRRITLPGETVLFQGRTHGNTVWGALGTAVTDDNGQVSFPHTPGGNVDYRLVYGGQRLADPATSAIGYVTVKPKLTAAISGSAGTSFTIRGTLAPTPAGQYAWLEQYTRSGWKGVQKHLVAASYAWTVAPAAPGVTRYRVNRPADRTHLAVISPVFTFTTR